jgi:hypothetical protein
MSPDVCVHEVGWAVSKSTLWKLEPDGYPNATVPPAAIVTVVAPGLLGSWKPKSYASMLAVDGAAAPTDPDTTKAAPVPATRATRASDS